MEDVKGVFILKGRVSRSLARKDVGIGGETRVATFHLPRIEDMTRFTHFVLEFPVEVRGTAEIRAQCGILGTQGIDLDGFVGHGHGQGDPCAEQLRQAVHDELDSSGVVDSSGDVIMARKVDVICWDSSVKPGVCEGEEYGPEMIYWKLEDESRNKKGQKDGQIFTVRICFQLNSVLGNGKHRIVQNGDPCVAALSIHTTPGSTCAVKNGDKVIFYGPVKNS
ncbi:uncharacterized protein TRIVIDRAFT_215156 [Trichoderma virens Gv29-8]|uniref:Uncharacterized protein n=1 Tax=Hypocrea virens (strain Gv29-8 / FGSC 10586) TaxID=413071 RepID=G9MGR8_HYPVG|nr:uncharacterized protein TRIVIDRAFT_215156 [Trichoderma virens Gv29-8]EHK25913.1 hypothetical protein TRIVIDRAFT_215156 [Trichoderma virens Gv29-8]UKZ46091.1 hypothetical protein TrVGV298_000289 [Trichoderma virens]